MSLARPFHVKRLLLCRTGLLICKNYQQIKTKERFWLLIQVVFGLYCVQRTKYEYPPFELARVLTNYGGI